MTSNLYVLGHPVAHSKSPAMYNAVYQKLGLNWEYGFMDCASEQDARAFLDAGDFLSINITTPYKELALSYAQTASVAATLARGANVLIAQDGAYAADNTDGAGAVAYLERVGAQFAGARVVVCGTGPAARSIMSAAAFAGAQSVALLGRDKGRTRAVLAAYKADLAALIERTQAQEQEAARAVDFNPFNSPLVRKTPDQVLAETDWSAWAYADAEADQAIGAADIVIDATTLGMKQGDPAPFDTALLHAGQIAFDVVYAHGETAFVAGARAAGAQAFDGEGMLVAQAVATVNDLAQTHSELRACDADLFALMAQAAGFDALAGVCARS